MSSIYMYCMYGDNDLSTTITSRLQLNINVRMYQYMYSMYIKSWIK